jgi:putative addiction module component (TIGR02574 family)
MMTVDKLRGKALGLSASERASLAHDLIISLENTDAYELSPEPEAEIRRRVRWVKEGKATGRTAKDVFADIEAEMR